MIIINKIKDLFKSKTPISESQAKMECAIGNLSYVKKQMESHMRIFGICFTDVSNNGILSWSFYFDGIEQAFPDGCHEDKYTFNNSSIIFYPQQTNYVSQINDIISFMKYKRKGTIDIVINMDESLIGIFNK